MRWKAFGIALGFAVATVCVAGERPRIYIEPQQGFESSLAAAIVKKQVPVEITTKEAVADYILRTKPVEVQKESTGGKVARCLFLSCAGIEDRANVSVELVKRSKGSVVWAYSVNKGRGQKNMQSLAEAVAKHLKEFLTSSGK